MARNLQLAGTYVGDVPAPFAFIRTSASDAMAEMVGLLRAQPEATPVILGDEASAASHFEIILDGDRPTPEETMSLVANTTSTALMDEADATIHASLKAWYAKKGKAPPAQGTRLPRGPWPEDVFPHQVPLTLVDPETGKPKGEVLIGVFNTSKSWEVPAYLRFGSWNGCPSPAIHTALGREWAASHGARLIVNTRDVIEYEISKPIMERAEAIKVAEHQFRYCEDIVMQGAGSIDALAAKLMGARYWYFWWD